MVQSAKCVKFILMKYFQNSNEFTLIYYNRYILCKKTENLRPFIFSVKDYILNA